MRFESYLGRPSLYINRGVALVRGASMENGTLEIDVAASDTTNFLGRGVPGGHAAVLQRRVPAAGSQRYRGGRPVRAGVQQPGSRVAGLPWRRRQRGRRAVPRNRWIHVRIELDGPVARLYVDTATAPTLVVPRVVASGGAGLGVWAGAFGRGAYFSNIRYAAAPDVRPRRPPRRRRRGRFCGWEISGAIEAADFTPGHPPRPGPDQLAAVEAEPEGFVLINRYREAPVGGVPRDSTGAVLVRQRDDGQDRGVADRVRADHHHSRARRDPADAVCLQQRRRHLPERPAARVRDEPGRAARQPWRDGQAGDAVYLPLRRGHNQLVFAVIECTGGWAFSARLDSLPVARSQACGPRARRCPSPSCPRSPRS